MTEDVRLVEKRFGDVLLTPLLANISRETANVESIKYLNEVKENIIENLDDFKEPERPSPQLPFMPPIPPRELFLEYDVNVVVDNSHTQGAPSLSKAHHEPQPLCGTIELFWWTAQGASSRIHPHQSQAPLLGAARRLCYLQSRRGVDGTAVWKHSSGTLKKMAAEIETYEPFAMFSTSGLKPEPVQIQVKVVVVGRPYAVPHALHAR